MLRDDRIRGSDARGGVARDGESTCRFKGQDGGCGFAADADKNRTVRGVNDGDGFGNIIGGRVNERHIGGVGGLRVVAVKRGRNSGKS